MCEIVGGIIREGNIAPYIHDALKQVQYRGYDSVGIGTLFEEKLFIKKDKGRIKEVHKRFDLDSLPGRIGIGHLRWATHGASNNVNSHPQIDCENEIAIVHNGIIHNFNEIKLELEDLGHNFRSMTDSEVISHLIEEKSRNEERFSKAVVEAVKQLNGSYDLAVINAKFPNEVLCISNNGNFFIFANKKGTYLASDLSAFLPLSRRIVKVEKGEFVILSDNGVKIRKIKTGKSITRRSKEVKWTIDNAKRKGYSHFLMREIHEQSFALKNSLRLQKQYLELMTTFLDRAKEVFLISHGTSYHCCLAAAYMFSKLAFLPTHPVISSEFIEQHGKAVNIESTILAVSQNGEEKDVLFAVDHARNHAATILGLTNVLGSTLTRISRVYICQQSGPDIGIISLKNFTSQLSVLLQLALKLGKKRGKISHNDIERIEEKLEKLPTIVDNILRSQKTVINSIAKKYHKESCFFFLGRGISSATALEGSLRMMEIAHVPSIAYPAGESKHGPISLIEKGFPTIFICPKDETRKKILGNIMEMKARGASIIAITEKGDEEIRSIADDCIECPREIPSMFSPIPYSIPLQLFAYYTALHKKVNPDLTLYPVQM